MADASVQRVALLAIHPEHATAILEGRKRVEFRKRRLAPEVEYVLLYATAPTQRVVGYFRIKRLDEGAPTAVWRRHGDRGAIPRRLFREYYSGAKTAVAWLVRDAAAFRRPMQLCDIGRDISAPQSFSYLPLATLHACAEGTPRSTASGAS